MKKSLDTSPKAEWTQIEIFRLMGPDKRLESAIRLAQTSRELLREGVRLRHPEYREQEIMLAIIRLSLGESLFRRAYPQAETIRP
jgi:hypothetical protein